MCIVLLMAFDEIRKQIHNNIIYTNFISTRRQQSPRHCSAFGVIISLPRPVEIIIMYSGWAITDTGSTGGMGIQHVLASNHPGALELITVIRILM